MEKTAMSVTQFLSELTDHFERTKSDLSEPDFRRLICRDQEGLNLVILRENTFRVMDLIFTLATNADLNLKKLFEEHIANNLQNFSETRKKEIRHEMKTFLERQKYKMCRGKGVSGGALTSITPPQVL